MKTQGVQQQKKAYVAPAVKSLGSIQTLTLGPSGGTVDALVGGTGGFQSGGGGVS